MANDAKLGHDGEREARLILRKHYTAVRKQRHNAPFDYTGTDKLTGQKTAIEVKTVNRCMLCPKGKLVHKVLKIDNRYGNIEIEVGEE